MKQHIFVGDEAYAIDTDEEIQAAREALRDAGLESAPVFAGEADGLGDAHRNGQILWAAEG